MGKVVKKRGKVVKNSKKNNEIYHFSLNFDHFSHFFVFGRKKVYSINCAR